MGLTLSTLSRPAAARAQQSSGRGHPPALACARASSGSGPPAPRAPGPVAIPPAATSTAPRAGAAPRWPPAPAPASDVTYKSKWSLGRLDWAGEGLKGSGTDFSLYCQHPSMTQ